MRQCLCSHALQTDYNINHTGKRTCKVICEEVLQYYTIVNFVNDCKDSDGCNHGSTLCERQTMVLCVTQTFSTTGLEPGIAVWNERDEFAGIATHPALAAAHFAIAWLSIRSATLAVHDRSVPCLDRLYTGRGWVSVGGWHWRMGVHVGGWVRFKITGGHYILCKRTQKTRVKIIELWRVGVTLSGSISAQRVCEQYAYLAM